jgi:hypothetical protein
MRRKMLSGSGVEATGLDTVTEKFTSARSSDAPESVPPKMENVPVYKPGAKFAGRSTLNKAKGPLDARGSRKNGAFVKNGESSTPTNSESVNVASLFRKSVSADGLEIDSSNVTTVVPCTTFWDGLAEVTLSESARDTATEARVRTIPMPAFAQHVLFISFSIVPEIPSENSCVRCGYGSVTLRKLTVQFPLREPAA